MQSAQWCVQTGPIILNLQADRGKADAEGRIVQERMSNWVHLTETKARPMFPWHSLLYATLFPGQWLCTTGCVWFQNDSLQKAVELKRSLKLCKKNKNIFFCAKSQRHRAVETSFITVESERPHWGDFLSKRKSLLLSKGKYMFCFCLFKFLAEPLSCYFHACQILKIMLKNKIKDASFHFYIRN